MADTQHDQDDHFIRHALTLARRGRGYVEPNPMVGAVVVRDGRIIGEGYHRRFGGSHAEIHALRAAGSAARGSTLYVTLEPCCHHGKTPPCTRAVIEAGVSRVVAAMVDPNPRVAGDGMRQLEQAGIATQVGPLTHQALELNEPFIKRQVTNLPFVIAKWAATLDGAIATATGHSQWISNPRSRRLVHQLRARVDAVVVGIGTALADNPMLTARDAKPRRVARRLVIDPRLELPIDSALVQSAEDVPLTVATSADALARQADHVRQLQAAGVELLRLPVSRGRLDLAHAMRYLVETHDATNVLVEGGAGTHGAFFEQGLVDEVWAFIAPRLVGDGQHLPPLRSPRQPLARMDQATRLELRTTRRLDDDLFLRYRVLTTTPT